MTCVTSQTTGHEAHEEVPDPVEHTGRFFDVPAAHIAPKPIQRPHPTLISGMWSEAGLERTARDFDGWNPAGLPVARVAEIVAGLEARRSPEQRPSHRSGRSQGSRIRRVIVDANFWDGIDSPEAWAALPDQLAPLLEAVRTT